MRERNREEMREGMREGNREKIREGMREWNREEMRERNEREIECVYLRERE